MSLSSAQFIGTYDGLHKGCARADGRFEQIVGSSSALELALAEVDRVAPTDSTVLILGETGTGKELIARTIHRHERGAFTGAISQKIGRFEMANTGTLFLDEIGDIPLALQSKLLRVLQEREFERLGGGRTHRINVRLVAATHRDLPKMVEANEFRSDLYYRLNVFPVVLPPLRERQGDVAQLVLHFVEIYANRMGKQIGHIPKETLDAFTSYSWPGNVRELQNLVERAVIRSDDGVLPNPLPAVFSNPLPASNDNRTTFPRGKFAESQRALILEALRAAGWVIGGPSGAAAHLGLKRTTLVAKMKKLGISRLARQKDMNRLSKSRGSKVPTQNVLEEPGSRAKPLALEKLEDSSRFDW